jgi:hypothetical protein
MKLTETMGHVVSTAARRSRSSSSSSASSSEDEHDARDERVYSITVLLQNVASRNINVT